MMILGQDRKTGKAGEHEKREASHSQLPGWSSSPQRSNNPAQFTADSDDLKSATNLTVNATHRKGQVWSPSYNISDSCISVTLPNASPEPVYSLTTRGAARKGGFSNPLCCKLRDTKMVYVVTMRTSTGLSSLQKPTACSLVCLTSPPTYLNKISSVSSYHITLKLFSLSNTQILVSPESSSLKIYVSSS